MLRRQEAIELLNSIKDPVTQGLAHRAHYFVLKRFAEQKSLPVADFDMLFFVQVLQQFCQEHDILKRLLAGERVGAWWDDE